MSFPRRAKTSAKTFLNQQLKLSNTSHKPTKTGAPNKKGADPHSTRIGPFSGKQTGLYYRLRKCDGLPCLGGGVNLGLGAAILRLKTNQAVNSVS